MARFHVYPARKGAPSPRPEPGDYILRPESLDDGGFRTTYQLRRLGEDGQEAIIGNLRILRRGQLTGRTSLPDSFLRLGEEYGSLGAELEFYSALSKAAGAETGQVLEALADLATNPDRRRRFENEPGFAASLVRFTPARAALEEAASLLNPPTPAEPVVSAGLTFQTSVGGDSVGIHFGFEDTPDLPGRISVIVGPNGSGKTRMLSNLALAAFDQSDQSGWGTFDAPLQFSRVLAFSYSAFDDFDVPAASGRQRAAFLRAGSGLGYRYFGLRDLGAARPEDGDRPIALKSSGQIRYDFQQAVGEALRHDPELMFRLLSMLFEEPSFGATGVRPPRSDEPEPQLRQLLLRLFGSSSTGHKFVLLMTAQLVAYVREGSLVLIDEPESHLHPPLLAAFLKVLRVLLAARATHAIVATHSPFVVQETPARAVRIVSRAVRRTVVRPPAGETFGEDIGTISREVFQLDARAGEFVDTLRDLAKKYSLDELEQMFSPSLSGQARAMVMAFQARGG